MHPKDTHVPARGDAGPAAGARASAGAGAGAAAAEHEFVRTSCGRLLTIGRLTFRTPAHPVGRVTLNVGCRDHGSDRVWMAMTPDEARQLARRLVAQAAIVEQDCPAGGEEPAADPAAALPPGRIEVVFVNRETYAVHVRGHHLLTDQPTDSGGRDMAATPTELLVASLASCVAFYCGHYLSRHDLPRRGLRVSAEFAMAEGAARVDAVRLRVRIPTELPPDRARALRVVASHCTVHNTLRQAPGVKIEFA